MDKKKSGNSGDQRGNVRYLWVLVGAYLLYLSWQQAQLLYREGGAGHPIISIVSGVVFVIVGAWVIFREWLAWRYAQAHKDDPETWGASGEDEETPDALKKLDAPEGEMSGADEEETEEGLSDEGEDVSEEEEASNEDDEETDSEKEGGGT